MLSSSTSSSSPRETESALEIDKGTWILPRAVHIISTWNMCPSNGEEVGVVAVDSYDVSRTFMHELLWNTHKCVIPR